MLMRAGVATRNPVWGCVCGLCRTQQEVCHENAVREWFDFCGSKKKGQPCGKPFDLSGSYAWTRTTDISIMNAAL